MQKINLNWQMCSEERSFDEKTRCGVWILELNSEWKVKCICEQNKQRNPSFIEVHRKSLSGEIIISGTLEIREEKGQCLLKKKFVSLLEDCCLFTRIDIQSCHSSIKAPTKMFLVTGEITIGSSNEDSLDLTEMVCLTKTDYSSLRQLSNDMEKLLLKKSLLADVTLKCGDVSIPAHKSILSARSVVFEAMFKCPWKEATENEVVIEDIESPVLQAMVKYLYTGKIESLSTPLAVKLLFVASKYQIMCLESACSKYLIHNMSMKDVLVYLCQGGIASPVLKKSVIDFVCNNCTDYSALEEMKSWKILKNHKPALALEIFSAVVKFQEQKLKTRI